MERTVAVAKAISDPNRIRALMVLRDGTLCVCQIMELLGLVPSTVSKHMSILEQADLVQWRKEGRWRYYRLPGNDCPIVVKQTLKWLQSSLDSCPDIEKDKRSLKITCKKPLKDCAECYQK